MSTLRATNIKNPDSGDNNIVLDGSGGVIISGVTTSSNFVGNVTGDATGLSGTPNLNVGVVTASSFVGNVTGNVTGTLLGTPEIAGISSSISDTAVDIFIYDTRKDSDGGAWRKRTQHTSWYNETLNTATRGSRKEFPAVAVIVAESTQVTIYDGDDPDLPMWMVFEVGRTPTVRVLNWYTSGTASISSVFQLNSKLCIGTPGGVTIFDFASDDTRLSYNTLNYEVVPKTISTRNNLSTVFSGGNGYNIIQPTINDVAMTVLPNAPIDSATGLPVPTIVVATDGGASVIKDDGNVYDDTDTSGLGKVDFNDDYRVISTRKATGFPAARFFISKRIDTVSSDSAWLYEYYTGNFASGYPRLRSEDTGAGITLGLKGDTSVRGSNIGFTLWDVNSNQIGPNEYSTNSLLCGISTSFNTGWMHGDIKGAFLSDTTAESLAANTNLVSNFTQIAIARLTSETYDAGDTSWQIVDDAANDNGYLLIGMTGLTIGQSYIVSMTWDNNAALDAGYDHQVIHKNGLAGENSTIFSHWDKTNVSSETLTGVFVAQSVNDDDLLIYANAITLNVSNFIVRAVDDEDRSVNNKGLQVFGTVTKSAVATGAELVAYSGFSDDTNFLRQPYNSDLDFGTGDFSATGWFKMSDVSTTGFIFDRANVSSGGSRIAVYTEYSLLKFYTFDGSANTEETSSISGFNNAWVHFVATRSSNGYTAIYLNGNLKDSMTATSKNVTNTSASTTIGARFTGATNSFSGSIALLRFSGSIPSPEQIKKIYEDEKVLFQENAACTLYGSSDAVTALAYDDSTNLLYAGTSSGRSDFQGLRRINNTTTAVATAISASNGLVAEQ